MALQCIGSWLWPQTSPFYIYHLSYGPMIVFLASVVPLPPSIPLALSSKMIDFSQNSTPRPINSFKKSANPSLYGLIWYYIIFSVHFFHSKSCSRWQVEFDFPYSVNRPEDYSQHESIRVRSKLIAKALKNALNLEIVSSPAGTYLPSDLITISQNPSLKTICVKHFARQISSPFREALMLESNAKLRALIRFEKVTWVF